MCCPRSPRIFLVIPSLCRIPTALALGWARSLIDQGKFPGVTAGEANFYATLFEDSVQVNPAGAFARAQPHRAFPGPANPNFY